MKAIKFTIQTRMLLIILLSIVGGLISILFFGGLFHQINNTSRLSRDAELLMVTLENIKVSVTQLNVPAKSCDWLITQDSKRNQAQNLHSQLNNQIQILQKNSQYLPESELKILAGKFILQANDLSSQYILFLDNIEKRGCLRSGYVSDLILLNNKINNLAKARNVPFLTGFAYDFNETLTAWLNNGNPIDFQKLSILQAEFTSYETARIASLPENTKLELRTSLKNIAALIREIGLLEQALSPTDKTGIELQLKEYLSVSMQLIGNVNILSHAYSEKLFYSSLIKSAVFIAILISFLVILVYWVNRNLRTSIGSLRHFFTDLVKGNIPEALSLQSGDEFSEMSAQLNHYANDLKKKTSFALEIGAGELNATYLPLGPDDQLGNALINLQKSMKDAVVTREKHEVEEQKRRWINEGLAKFAEILRMNNNNILALSDAIIQNLVRYLKANQGGLYLVNEGNGELLELVSAFAFDRKKYINQTIPLGEGLVGTCAIEKESILLTDVPSNYISISSGLGDANPRCIVIVPLKLEEKILGVLEIASFQQIEKHELDFLEKIAESIGSTIATVRINMQTEQLLEQSQHQTQELAEKEEEMRQSMEELQATQEESERRELEITGILNAINSSSLVFELDLQEIIIHANTRFCALLGTKIEILLGKRFSTLIATDPNTEAFVQFLDDLKSGKPKSRIDAIKLPTGKIIWISMSFTPILNQERHVRKILCIATDITESKEQETNLQSQAKEIARKNQELESLNLAVDSSILRVTCDVDAIITDVNENYLKITGHVFNEVVGYSTRHFLKPDELEQFEKIWTEIMKGKSYTGVVKRTRPTGEEFWLMSNFTPVKDEKGMIYKVYFLAQDITERKLKYKLLEEANKEIERLKSQLPEKS